MRDIAEFFYRPDQKRYGIALYSDNSYDAVAMGVEQTIFSYGGDLGDYSTYKIDGIINSKQAIDGLKAYRDLFKFTPPGWGKVFFLENNQAITEGLGGDEHELLRLLSRPWPTNRPTRTPRTPASSPTRPVPPARISRRWAGRASPSCPTRRSARPR